MSEDMVELMLNRELGWEVASIGVFLLAMVWPFVYFFRDCRRHSESDFPALIYGAKAIRSCTMKKIWTWTLILTFILSLRINMDIVSNTSTIAIRVPETGTTGLSAFDFTPPESILTLPPPLEFEFGKVGSNSIYEKIALSIPWPFLVGLYLYDRGVRRWPQGEKTDQA
jgi:hypothetical protein